MFGRCAAAFCWACIEDARHERAAREIIDLFIRIDKLVMLYVCRNCWGFGHFQKKVYKSTKKFWILSFEFWIIAVGDFEFWILSFEFWIIGKADFEFLNFEFWIIKSQFKIEQFKIAKGDNSKFKTQNSKIANGDNSKLKTQNSKSALPTIQNSKLKTQNYPLSFPLLRRYVRCP